MSVFLFPAITTIIGAIKKYVDGREIATNSGGAFRPTEWYDPAQTSITLPGAVHPATTGFDSVLGTLPGAPAFTDPPTVYVFDAILRAEHQRELRITEHPVQTGAAISDHAYRLPSRVTLEIGMSDVMDSYEPGTWDGDSSKSVNAYRTLLEIQASRQLLQLTTRLNFYENMLIESVETSDSNKTLFGLRARVSLVEIFLATATASKSRIVSGAVDGTSARPQTTDTSQGGTVQPTPVPQAIKLQNKITPAAIAKIVPKAAAVPGAGVWGSSNNANLDVFNGIQ